MSPTYNYSSDAQRDVDLELNHTTPFGTNNLSPYHSQTLSNSASPSYNTTPGESISEYSTYQPSDSEAEDPFFGVDFDAGVPRVDSIPTQAILGNVAYQSANLNRPLPPLPPQDETPLSATTTSPTYPLSPIHSSKPSTPSPKRVPHKPYGTISQQELISGLHNAQFTTLNSVAPTHPVALQLTPDYSGSSHTSAEGVAPSTMARVEQSPHLTVSQWDFPTRQDQASGQYNHANVDNFAGSLPSMPSVQNEARPVLRDHNGSWRTNRATGQGGLDPESRKELKDVELPTLGEQEERQRIGAKNIEVDEWRSQAGGSDIGDDQTGHSNFPQNNPSWSQQSRQAPHDDDDGGITPLDDAASVHENCFVEGQVYFDFGNTHINDFDIQLMRQPRHWSDAPAVPDITTEQYQPGTAQAAIDKFNRHADTISIASRAATWGTRRRSAPSLLDFEGVSDGSFLKKLAITSKPNDRTRQGSIFDRGLGGLANMVRKRSDSKLKRARSAANIPEESESYNHPRQGSSGTLNVPTRKTSVGRNKPSTPTLNTASAFAAMAGIAGAVGTTHARSNSVSGGANTSPKSPIHLGVDFTKSVFNRNRSKSDVTARKGAPDSSIAGLWRGQGGPPVARLATQRSQGDLKRPEAQHQDDVDDEDEDDDEQMDDNDMAETEHSTQPIVPNYEGFKAHVRRLNPDMEPRHNWLVSRVAHQQEIRYKNLLDLRVKHQQAIANRNCASGPYCLSLGEHVTSDANGTIPGNQEGTPGGLQLQTDFSDDSNPGEGALTDETFPSGVPMPPTRNLPAEFECQLCFKVKKFQKPSDWTKHVHEDVQPFTCTYEKCKEPKSFKRKADWVRHENERHRHLEWWICQVEDCRHPCYRKDNFLQHLVREHKLPEPKQKTKAAIKKARLTEPAWVLLEKCHHETHNRPQDEPCKFCGKSFPTWKKLTVHLAKHMEYISLPVLRLVEAKIVDANTIISPVENNLTPVTPNSRTKLESTSPFSMNDVSPHLPLGNHFGTSGFEQSSYFQTTGPTNPYGMQAPSLSQGFQSHVNDLYPNAFQPMNQPRNFQPLNSNTMGHISQPPGYQVENMTAAPFQPKIEQQDSYDPMDTCFTIIRTQMQNQQNFNGHRNQHQNSHSPYSISQPFSAAPNSAASNYAAPNMLGINDAGFGFDVGVNPAQGYGVHQPQVPMSRAQGSASSYGNNGHSPHTQQNTPFY